MKEVKFSDIKGYILPVLLGIGTIVSGIIFVFFWNLYHIPYITCRENITFTHFTRCKQA